MKIWTYGIGIAALLVAAHAAAAGADAIKAFVNEVKSARAVFRQTVADADGRTLQQSSGSFQFARPGKFRWVYEKPYEQLIVGDGAKVWIYDRDLNQVTVKALGAALGSSPAALLAGSNDLERDFTLTDSGSKDGLDWLDAVPKTRDTAFERVRMGFGKAGLAAMELRDQFGQITVITFADVERNPRIPAEVFRFTPPKGADVISE